MFNPLYRLRQLKSHHTPLTALPMQERCNTVYFDRLCFCFCIILFVSRWCCREKTICFWTIGWLSIDLTALIFNPHLFIAESPQTHKINRKLLPLIVHWPRFLLRNMQHSRLYHMSVPSYMPSTLEFNSSFYLMYTLSLYDTWTLLCHCLSLSAIALSPFFSLSADPLSALLISC